MCPLRERVLWAHVRLAGLVPELVMGISHTLHVTGTDPTSVTEALEAMTETQARLIPESEVESDGGATNTAEPAGLVEWVVPTETVTGALIEHEVHVLEASADSTDASFQVETAADADVRALLDPSNRHSRRPSWRPDGSEHGPRGG